MAALLSVLAADWLWTGRPASALGLGIPIAFAGQIGLAIAVVLIASLVIVTSMSTRRPTLEKQAAMKAKFDAVGLLPRTARDWPAFLVCVALLGGGWELLYRAFLFGILARLIGTIGAIVVAALAYGLAHNYDSGPQRIASVVAAFLFTIAYAATLSLWWLMLIHIAMPLLPALIRSRMAKPTIVATS